MTNAREFTARLAELLRRERDAMAEFLVLLADFDQGRLWLELGHASLFSFLHRELGLSKGASHYRKTAAELLRRFPEIVAPLRDGRLCITSIVELATVLPPENRGEVLPRFFHRSKREAAEGAAEIRPQEAPARRELVTAVRAEPRTMALPSPSSFPAPDPVSAPRDLTPFSAPARGLTSASAPAPTLPSEPSRPPETSLPVQPAEQPNANSTPSAPNFPPPERTTIAPLTADLRRLHVTVSRRFLEKLEAARAALSHVQPGASAEEILEAGLDLLLARDAKKKGQVEKPLSTPRRSHGDHVPAHVRREVWRRDGGRCQWALESGGICGSTHRLELDHVIPRARGGPSTAANLRLLCQTHNLLAARRVLGDDLMDRFAPRTRARSMRSASTPGGPVPGRVPELSSGPGP